MHDWLIINLKGPMMSFGCVTIDGLGRTRDFPSKSMMVGMVGCALGIDRSEADQLQDIQDRMIMGSAIVKEGRILEDTQNVEISSTDIAWTTRREPVKRGGGSVGSADRRKRQYIQDGHVLVAMRMQGKGGVLTEHIHQAFIKPRHPVFIGRKCCPPSIPLIDTSPFEKASNAYEALKRRTNPGTRAQWDAEDGPTGGNAVYQIRSAQDLKNWKSKIHQGHRRVVEGDT